jgi:hypothetical protein
MIQENIAAIIKEQRNKDGVDDACKDLIAALELDFVHIDRRSGGERQSVGEAVEEGTGDFAHVVG